MLLDQQRTRKMTRIVAIVMVVGLVGVLPVALGVILFGGGGDHNSPEQLLKDAEAKVAANPKDISALVQLASQYQSQNRPKDAADTLDRAVAAGPRTTNELRLLVGALAGEKSKQLGVLKTYTKANPKDAEAWLTYATTAAVSAETLTARLAYQRVLALTKPGDELHTNATDGLAALEAQSAPQVVPTTPGS